jgi:hypothetical protein
VKHILLFVNELNSNITLMEKVYSFFVLFITKIFKNKYSLFKVLTFYSHTRMELLRMTAYEKFKNEFDGPSSSVVTGTGLDQLDSGMDWTGQNVLYDLTEL